MEHCVSQRRGGGGGEVSHRVPRAHQLPVLTPPPLWGAWGARAYIGSCPYVSLLIRGAQFHILTKNAASRLIECFHMSSRRPYWCPKTMKRQPCWCPKRILWELNSFLMQTFSFVPINLHRCWPREWKHSIKYNIKLSCCKCCLSFSYWTGKNELNWIEVRAILQLKTGLIGS